MNAAIGEKTVIENDIDEKNDYKFYFNHKEKKKYVDKVAKSIVASHNIDNYIESRNNMNSSILFRDKFNQELQIPCLPNKNGQNHLNQRRINYSVQRNDIYKNVEKLQENDSENKSLKLFFEEKKQKNDRIPSSIYYSKNYDDPKTIENSYLKKLIEDKMQKEDRIPSSDQQKVQPSKFSKIEILDKAIREKLFNNNVIKFDHEKIDEKYINSHQQINSPIKVNKIDTYTPIRGNQFETPINSKNNIIQSPSSYRSKLRSHQDKENKINLEKENSLHLLSQDTFQTPNSISDNQNYTNNHEQFNVIRTNQLKQMERIQNRKIQDKITHSLPNPPYNHPNNLLVNQNNSYVTDSDDLMNTFTNPNTLNTPTRFNLPDNLPEVISSLNENITEIIKSTPVYKKYKNRIIHSISSTSPNSKVRKRRCTSQCDEDFFTPRKIRRKFERSMSSASPMWNRRQEQDGENETEVSVNDKFKLDEGESGLNGDERGRELGRQRGGDKGRQRGALDVDYEQNQNGSMIENKRMYKNKVLDEDSKNETGKYEQFQNTRTKKMKELERIKNRRQMQNIASNSTGERNEIDMGYKNNGKNKGKNDKVKSTIRKVRKKRKNVIYIRSFEKQQAGSDENAEKTINENNHNGFGKTIQEQTKSISKIFGFLRRDN